MSILRTVEDLRQDALWRAGDPPTDTTGSFWSKTIEYLNRIQQALLLGGTIAVGRDLATSAGIYAHLVDLPITDWWWARKRGFITTVARRQGQLSTTLNSGDTQCALAGPLPNTTDFTGQYVMVGSQPTVLRVQSVGITGTTVVFDGPYVDDAQAAGTTITFAQMEYDLPKDFLRFSSPPYVHSVFGQGLNVSSIEQRNSEWPLALQLQGRPTRAFMVGPQRIALNSYDTRAYRCEFEYIAMPADLVEGGEPSLLPLHHRSVLCAGAAMLIALDKGDPKSANFASEYRETVSRMIQEHRRMISGGSTTFGAFKTRQPSLIRRSPQVYGELFLV
jgi:hypothetical protein